MNSCCNLPVEQIAIDKHKIGESCCLVTERTAAPARAECPISHTLSRKVQHRTLEHLLKPEKLGSLHNVQYYYCTESTCEVVYFSNENAPYFVKDDVAVRVFAKDSADDVNVCYCFNWTRGQIKEQVRKTGTSTAPFEIAQEVKSGNCACDIKNPKGECCLGDVNALLKQAVSNFMTSL